MKILQEFKIMAKAALEHQISIKEKHRNPEVRIFAESLLKTCEALELCQQQRNKCMHIPIQQYRMKGHREESYDKEIQSILEEK